MFKHPFSFNGRIRRLEYGISYIIYICAIIFISYLMDISEVLGIILIPIIWFLLAQNTKRCHDRGNTGWYQLIPFYIIIMLFGDSEIGQNQFGNNPKGIGNIDEIDQLGEHLEK
jgi:uncharacterized membrane protein YhaH (DUF805 family)